MSFYEPNGILAKIPGDLISRAGQTLPAPDDGQPAVLQAEIDGKTLLEGPEEGPIVELVPELG